MTEEQNRNAVNRLRVLAEDLEHGLKPHFILISDVDNDIQASCLTSPGRDSLQMLGAMESLKHSILQEESKVCAACEDGDPAKPSLEDLKMAATIKLRLLDKVLPDLNNLKGDTSFIPAAHLLKDLLQVVEQMEDYDNE